MNKLVSVQVGFPLITYINNRLWAQSANGEVFLRLVRIREEIKKKFIEN